MTMNNDLVETITSREGRIRHRSERELLSGKSREALIQAAERLEIFRHVSDNLYHKVRASLFIAAIYRFHLIDRKEVKKTGRIPFEGVKAAMERHYDEAIEIYRVSMVVRGMNEAILSALADAYYHLAFKYLADQVKLSISRTRGNHLLFKPQGEIEVPFRVRDEYKEKDPIT
ncbi:MAG: UTP--glucose-1-phosphate uridylyltransferase, partial [Planctomycetes bacterium]|nr:UTP--glucose-1-phosphate uridylyltransferase [Planctomycetota bacterium]